MKANSTLGVLGVLVQLGAGADIVSAGELYRWLRAGGDRRVRSCSRASARPKPR